MSEKPKIVGLPTNPNPEKPTEASNPELSVVKEGLDSALTTATQIGSLSVTEEFARNQIVDSINFELNGQLQSPHTPAKTQAAVHLSSAENDARMASSWQFGNAHRDTF